MAHILIAGLGDLGQALATQWLGSGHRVSGIRRQNEAPAGIDLYAQNLVDGPVLLPPDQVDLLYIILTPADRSVEGYQRAFLHAPKRLLDALAAQQPLPPVIFVSSTAVYGDCAGNVDEQTRPKPNRYNGRILLAAEEELSIRSLCTVVRFSGIYGPGRHRLLRQVEEIAAGAEAPAPSWSNRIHSEDCVRLLKHLGERWLAQEELPALIIGTDAQPTVNTRVLNWLAQQHGTPLSLPEPDLAPGKRLKSLYLSARPELLRYPDFRDGYAAVLAQQA